MMEQGFWRDKREVLNVLAERGHHDGTLKLGAWVNRAPL